MEDILSLYLPIAEIRVNVLLLTLLGVGVGFLSGMFGIGGGIILLPIMIFIGVPTTVAVSTVTNIMTASASSGFLAYARRNRVDYKLGFLLLIGGIVGSVVGVYIFEILDEAGKIDLFISMSFIIILSVVGFVMGKEAIEILYCKYTKMPQNRSEHWLKERRILPMHIVLPSCKHSVSILSPMFIGMGGGIMISIMGIGGGVIMVPAMIYILRVSDAFTAGTVQFQVMFTAIIATLLHTAAFNTLDMVLAITLILGVVVGVQWGAKVGIKCNQENFRLLLAILIILLCIRVAINLYSEPACIYEITSD